MVTGDDHEDSTGRYLADIRYLPRLTAEQELALGERIAHGDAEALRRMVEGNLRLVISVAKHYHHTRLSLLDLVQEGNLGLMHAARRYDSTKGYRFSTYAIWHIRSAISRAIINQGQTIRVPVHPAEDPAKRERHAFQKPRREPIASEQAAEARHRPSEQMLEMARTVQDPLSLDRALDDAQETHLGDVLEDHTAISPVAETEQAMLRDQLIAMLATLSTRERTVISLRYGLVDGQPRTLAEVGAAIGLTRERIRQLELQALRRLRKQSQGADLSVYL